jgi:hypothetical protein
LQLVETMTNPAIQISVQNMDPTRTLFVDSSEDPHSAATVREIAPGASAYLPLREGMDIRLGTAAFETRSGNAGRVEAPIAVKQNPAVGDHVPVPPEPIGASQQPPQVQTQTPVQSQAQAPTPRRTQPPQRRA